MRVPGRNKKEPECRTKGVTEQWQEENSFLLGKRRLKGGSFHAWE